MVKQCSQCHQLKNETEFYQLSQLRTDGSRGLMAKCKSCQSAYVAKNAKSRKLKKGEQ